MEEINAKVGFLLIFNGVNNLF